MDKKVWYKSKGIWAGIITTAAGAAIAICKLFGIDLNTNAIFGFVLSILGAVGLYSRATADTVITK